MNDYIAIAIAEGQEIYRGSTPPTKKQFLEAWQHLIDTGLCWRLQGWFGRTASLLIEKGHCRPSENK